MCLVCREVIEVMTAKLVLETSPNPAPPLGFDVGRLHFVPEPPLCMRCGAEAHTPWDRQRRPCPRCDAPLNLTELKVFFSVPDPPVVMELGNGSA